ncbi:2-aminoethylphosphonate ABC transporter substrate-binding protein [Kitasatospora terrestris]|uniref:2-aminoethylphosphonate ABC transporter substrate-binding protein n=1 Tax=Kitasatospora terrestris TaxID=258051 RepID=A0ABP9EP67_9ACTN
MASASGLSNKDGTGFYDRAFRAFTEQTGIRVRYSEAGSGEIVQQLESRKNAPRTDLVVVLPPFSQHAAEEGLLDVYRPKGAADMDVADRAPDGYWTAIVNTYLCFIHNRDKVKEPPKTWADLLSPKYRGKVQYSTPGVAGDGTAVLIKAIHDFGGEQPALEYLKDLQVNNAGPSGSTGKLADKVDSGEIWIANGDVQMNVSRMAALPNQGIFFLAPNGRTKPTTLAVPYTAGVVKGAPHGMAARRLVDFLLSHDVQQTVSSTSAGLPIRDDVEDTSANSKTLKDLMAGVEVFVPDWSMVDRRFEDNVNAWKAATGIR